MFALGWEFVTKVWSLLRERHGISLSLEMIYACSRSLLWEASMESFAPSPCCAGERLQKFFGDAGNPGRPLGDTLL
jgi:hypothetical protein